MPAGKISRLGEDDNFWPAGAPTNGPDGVCGPCSEIFADVGTENVEIWNLVFTQFNRVGPPPNNLKPLPKKNIDTGMGLERTAAVLQGMNDGLRHRHLQTDRRRRLPTCSASSTIPTTISPPRSGFAASANTRGLCCSACTKTCSRRRRCRATSCAGFFGRALVDAWRLGSKSPLLFKLVPTIVAQMRKPYPELDSNAGSVAQQMKAEEENFLARIEGGLASLESAFKKLGKGGVLSGKEAFSLHATHGFPIDLTAELAQARGVAVDRDGFDEEMTKHRGLSGKGAFATEVFAVGPLQKTQRGGRLRDRVRRLSVNDRRRENRRRHQRWSTQGLRARGTRSSFSTAHPFMARQAGRSATSAGSLATVSSLKSPTRRRPTATSNMSASLKRGEAKVGAKVKRDRERRPPGGHSTGALGHAPDARGLHHVLGQHATQKGSKVEWDELRFDFSHPKPMTPQEIAAVEEYVLERIMETAPVATDVMPIAEAKKLGAMALFGEKYGDAVRVVSMTDFSRELCGGCHVPNTGAIGPFRIVREESVAAGVRRLIAYTGPKAFAYQRDQERLLARIGGPARVAARGTAEAHRSAPERNQRPAEVRVAAEVVGRGRRRRQAACGEAFDRRRSHRRRQSGRRVGRRSAGLGDQLRAKANPAAVFLASAESAEKVTLVASVAKELQDKIKAGDWIKEIAPHVDGKGGGRPDSAQAGGKSPAKIDAALAAAQEWAEARLNGLASEG